MRKLNIRRMVSAALAVVLAMSLTVGAFAAEIGIPTDRPDLAVIAAQFVNWDGSYELPNLNELSEEDQELVKAMVNAAMVASEAEAQTGAQPTDGTEAQAEAILAETPPEDELLPAVTGFSDVPSTHGFYTAIMDCAAKGITSGYADGTFRPTNSVTRAQFCVMLSRAFYPNEVKKYDTEEYKNVWFGPNTKALSAAGVLTRTSFQYAYNTSRAMDQVINRYDMATLMTNIMAKKGFSATATQKTEAQKKIADYKSIPSQYQDAVKNVFALGIITGYSDGTFGGERVMNRGQGCVVIYRMMKYTPATNTGNSSGDTYDDGKNKPSTSTGSNTGSTGNTGNTGSSSGNTSTGTNNTGTTNKTGVLANGKAITEANVLAIIQDMLKKYPDGTKWDSKTYRPGTPSTAMLTVEKEQITAEGWCSSTLIACGGFASLVSDTIFGSGNANPARKIPLEYIRPGDILIKRDANGNHMHYAVAASRITGLDPSKIAPVATVYDGNHASKIRYMPSTIIPKTCVGPYQYYFEAWTRYPTDNTTPWTSSSSSSGNTGNGAGSTGNTGSTDPTTTVNWITSNNPCGVCGKTGGQQVRSADGARYVCRTCYEDPSGIGKWFVE